MPSASKLENWRQALQDARDAFNTSKTRLTQVEEERENLHDELTKLRRTITALAALCSESPDLDQLGITEAVSTVMDNTTTILTTKEVVAELYELGFDLSSQKNAVASVHTVLSRMANANKIERAKNVGGEVTWKGPNYDPDDIPF